MKAVSFIGLIFEKTGFKSPVAFLQGKALQGDSSDCISGVGGIGEATAIKILAEYGSVNEFWKLCDAGLKPPSKALRSLYAGNSHTQKRNGKANSSMWKTAH
ncbi:5'-3' exonuclease H3TH domain-containing protein [Acinetobacter baumannii]|uniref:5'-3' exonuclease H3TH domain-containing protein n=1 Tax=Acinetobacter baumannii TaxID=470 RepID=UPI0036F45D50